jgi:hypothetical protein
VYNSFSQDFVKEFHQLSSKAEEEVYILKYQGKSISHKAFVLSLEMKKAEYTWQPWKKWAIFISEKNKLESLIQQNPENIYLRYIRFLIQQKVPKIVGYRSNLEEDKEMISRFLQQDKENELAKYFKI